MKIGKRLICVWDIVMIVIVSASAYAQDPLFAPAVCYGTGGQPHSVFAGDLDGDGDKDLAVVNMGNNLGPGNLSILINNGDGVFQAAVSYAGLSWPGSVFASDLDGDGDNDLAVGGDRISIFMNNGDGTFQAPVNYSGSGNSIFAADLDGDDDKDLAVVGVSISIFMNNGDGTFLAPVNYAGLTEPLSAFASDLDGDGDTDLAMVGDYGISTVMNNGDGTFQAPVNYSGSGNSIFAADLDGDDDKDLSITYWDVSTFMNNGNGTFQAPVNYGVLASPLSVFASDLDGDGDNDLAVSVESYFNAVAILLNNGDGTFQEASYYPVDVWPTSVIASDLDGDGDNDLAVTCSSWGNVCVLINLTNTGVPPSCEYLIGDINGDHLRNGGDVTYGVRFFKLIGNRPPDSCYMDSTGKYIYVAGDVNGNCEFRASDITRLVAYIKLIAPLQYCHFFAPPLPVLTTAAVSGVTQTTAECGGTITSDGGAPVIARGVCWSTDSIPTIADSKTTDGSGMGSFTSSITGLTDSTAYYVRAYATNSVGTGYGSIRSFTTLDSNTVIDIDGNVYQTITIGTQVWMAENLKVTHYRNGNAIPYVPDAGTWTNLTTGAYCNYNNDVNNVAVYGRLYNWYAVSDSRNIAPFGWHVPSDAEWDTLVVYLGGYTVAGGKMKEAGFAHWNSPNTGATNESGFSALPGGYRYSNGSYDYVGYGAILWSSTEYGSYSAWNRHLDCRSSGVGRVDSSMRSGFSVRCVRD